MADLAPLEHSPQGGEFVWSKFPLFGWLGGRFYTKRAFESVIRKHLEQVKITCEERAARSHVFRQNNSQEVSSGQSDSV